MKFIIKTPEDFLNLLNQSSGKNKKSDNYGHMDESEDIDEFIDGFSSEDVGIFDISDITLPIIGKENTSYNKDYWYNKLDTYYIDYQYKPMQIDIETKKLYEKLCNYLDCQLKKQKTFKKTSLIKLINKLGIRQSSQSHILNILYQTSESTVMYYYTKENNDNRRVYRYNKLQSYLGDDLTIKLYEKINKYVEELSPIERETRWYYNMTENGFKTVWWDTDGEIRANYTFDNKYVNFTYTIPFRQNKVWDINGARALIVALYLDICLVMINELNTQMKWNNKIKEMLSYMTSDKNVRFIDYNYGGLLESLIKLAENTVRDILPSTSTLKIDEDIENIKYYLPKPIAENVFALCEKYHEYISNNELSKVVDEMIISFPKDWKLKAWLILNKSHDEQIDLIISYANDVNLIKIIKEVINKSDNKNLLLFCLYALSINENLTIKYTKLLSKLIYDGNMPLFYKLQGENHDLTITLYQELIQLKEPIRKKIELNLDKIQESKDVLNNTVDKISEYIGEDIVEEIVENIDIAADLIKEKEVKQEINNATNISQNHLSLIKSLLEYEKLEIDIVKEIATKNGALLGSFISGINKELYEYVQDQAIIIDEDYVMIDEFYIDMIKELIRVNE